MVNLNNEKHKALETLKTNIENSASYIKLSSDKVEINNQGIKTAIRTPEDYQKIWLEFLKIEEDFKHYMGYGKEEILKIGKKKFIDFADIRSGKDINFYRRDRVKVIPCCNCKSEFTTLQLDTGLCAKCTKDFDMELFDMMCENENESTLIQLLALFVYKKDYREMFRLNRNLEDEISDCINIDNFNGFYSYTRLEKHLKGKSSNKLIKVLKNFYKKEESEIIKNRLQSVIDIISSGENAPERIMKLFSLNTSDESSSKK